VRCLRRVYRFLVSVLRWEHKLAVIKRPISGGRGEQTRDSETLNELGAEGWEAVGVAMPSGGDDSGHVLVLLKRQVK
jgi:hypothetical protein